MTGHTGVDPARLPANQGHTHHQRGRRRSGNPTVHSLYMKGEFCVILGLFEDYCGTLKWMSDLKKKMLSLSS